jgi:Uma2 family endonuclease
MARNLTSPDEYILPAELLGIRHPVTPQQFEQFCSEYRDLRLELTSTGDLIVMPPAGPLTSRRNFDLTYQLGAWCREHDSGVCFGPDAGFTLPNGAIRSPDASWIKREKWDHLTQQQKNSFSSTCPDFAVELRSPSDSLKQLRLKMFEYLENGTSLAWLIDPSKRTVYVYRPNQEAVVLDNPETVSGDPLLPGFTLKLRELWSVD